MATVNALELIVDLDDDFGWLGVVPLVDGRGLFDDWFGVSVPADDLLLDPSPLIEGLPHRVVLRMCTCAIVGCGTAGVVISASETAVRWTNWEISLQFDDERFAAQPHLPADLIFEINRYRATVIEAVDRARPRLPSSSRSGSHCGIALSFEGVQLSTDDQGRSRSQPSVITRQEPRSSYLIGAGQWWEALVICAQFCANTLVHPRRRHPFQVIGRAELRC